MKASLSCGVVFVSVLAALISAINVLFANSGGRVAQHVPSGFVRPEQLTGNNL
jgi:hypothetical protein